LKYLEAGKTFIYVRRLDAMSKDSHAKVTYDIATLLLVDEFGGVTSENLCQCIVKG